VQQRGEELRRDPFPDEEILIQEWMSLQNGPVAMNYGLGIAKGIESSVRRNGGDTRKPVHRYGYTREEEREVKDCQSRADEIASHRGWMLPVRARQ